MTWHVEIVPLEGLTWLLARIRNTGGTIACSVPGADGVRVTWASPGLEAEVDAQSASS